MVGTGMCGKVSVTTPGDGSRRTWCVQDCESKQTNAEHGAPAMCKTRPHCSPPAVESASVATWQQPHWEAQQLTRETCASVLSACCVQRPAHTMALACTASLFESAPELGVGKFGLQASFVIATEEEILAPAH